MVSIIPLYFVGLYPFLGGGFASVRSQSLAVTPGNPISVGGLAGSTLSKQSGFASINFVRSSTLHVVHRLLSPS